MVGPALTMGGMERASVNLANSLSLLGASVSYIAVLKQQHFFKLNKEIRFYEPPDFNVKKMSLLKTLFWLRNSIEREKPDKIIVFKKLYAALVLLSLAGTSYKVILSERSSPLYRWPFKIRMMSGIIFFLKSPEGIIAQTSIAAKYQRRYYGSKPKIKVIPNALREVQLYPEIQREKIVLAVGRLDDPLKGFDRLVEAFAVVKNHSWKLVFAGGDENGSKLKEQAKKLGVLDSVEFLGAVEDLDKVYARAGIFVIPSRSEGFPNALCEAMAAGLPCISFDFTAGPRDIIADGEDGIIVEDGNTKLLGERIRFLIENEDERKRLGENALKIKFRFNFERIGREHLDFIFS